MKKDIASTQNPLKKTSHQETTNPIFIYLLLHPWMIFFILSILAVLIYSNTFNVPFQFDDRFFIVENSWIKNSANLLDLSGSRYLGLLSFALNYQLGHLKVFGYHLVNLLIHITNGFLVYTLIRILFETPRMQSSSLTPDRSFWIASTAALLFVAHPVQTQAVTYITQRFASLATMFYLLSVVLYLKWRLASLEAKSRSLWYAGALLATVFAMKTKEITFTLPFMLISVDAIFFGSFTPKRWMTIIPFLLTLPIIPLSPLPEGSVETGDFIARESTAISRLDYLLTQFCVITTYLRLLILPIHQNLDYDYPIYHSLLQPRVFFSFLFLSALLGLTFYLLFYSRRSTHPRSSLLMLIGFGLFWFFLTLSIESSIIPIRDVIWEHRLYLPSIGFFLSVSAVVLNPVERRWRMNVIAIGVVVALLSVATYQRNMVWKDKVTLWRDVVQKSPAKGRAYYNLGMAYFEQGRSPEAIAAFEEAVQLKADPAAHLNLGNVYRTLGRADEAIKEYQAGLQLKPDYAEAHNNLGLVYKDLNRPEEAIQEFRIALKLKPKDVFAHLNLGNAYRTAGRVDEAIQEYKAALDLKPDFAEAHNNLGMVYKDLGRLDEAIQQFQTAIELRPGSVHTHYRLGQAYQLTGRDQEARREFEQALQIQHDYDPARQALKSLHQ